MTNSNPERPNANEVTSFLGNLLGAILVGTIEDNTNSK